MSLASIIITIIILFVVVPILFYIIPLRVARSRAKAANEVYISSINSLSTLFNSCVAFILGAVGERLLGEGGSQNSSITFEDALNNNDFAVKSVLSLIRSEVN